MLRRSLLLLSCLALLAATPLLAEDVVYSGVDAFHTVAAKTFADFANNPIPAGFFCAGSAAFAGKIQLKGVPLAVEPANALGGADTLFLRLDDAAFDQEGLAHTRLQIQALSLAGVRTLRNECGQYRVRVVLDGEQPISPRHHMTLVRENERGGYFLSEFQVRYKVSFVPVGGGPARELVRTSRFSGGADHKWAYLNSKQGAFAGSVKVDTNGDGKPDANVVGISNMAVGAQAVALLAGGANSNAAQTDIAITEADCGTHSIN